MLVVPSEDKVPAKMQALREYNGDKLIVAFDPEDGPLALQVAYSLARARVLMARGGRRGLDAAAVRDTVERALGALEDVRRIRQQLTGAKTQIDKASEIVERHERARARAPRRDRRRSCATRPSATRRRRSAAVTRSCAAADAEAESPTPTPTSTSRSRPRPPADAQCRGGRRAPPPPEGELTLGL